MHKICFTISFIVKKILCTKLVKYWDKCTEMQVQQNVKKKPTCFGQFLCPSSGVLHCTHSNGICHTGLLTACEQDQDGTSLVLHKTSSVIISMMHGYTNIKSINLLKSTRTWVPEGVSIFRNCTLCPHRIYVFYIYISQNHRRLLPHLT